MSTASTDPTSPSVANQPDAFGQAGMVQYLWPTVARASLLMAAVACVLWMRSHQIQDILLRESGSSRFQIASLHGRVGIFFGPSTLPLRPWGQMSVPLPNRDQWDDASSVFWGVQLSRGSGENSSTGLPPGSTRMRLRWRNIVMLLLICPAIYTWQKWRGRRVDPR